MSLKKAAPLKTMSDRRQWKKNIIILLNEKLTSWPTLVENNVLLM